MSDVYRPSEILKTCFIELLSVQMVSRGNDQVVISSKFETREDMGM